MNRSPFSKPVALSCVLTASMAVCLTGIAGCSIPAKRADQLALEAGFTRQIHTGREYQHVVYSHHLGTNPIEELHIYIEGDGTPWIDGRYPATDPTPRNPLALKLMREDPAPALYVGRPCYFGLASSHNCRPELWTSERYAPDVVASMLNVIRYYQKEYKVSRIVLIGYSGGGALAALLARELPGDVFLLTLAGNLNTDLWVELHGFLPLTGSLNPANYREQSAHIPQLHLVGLRDESVPVAVPQFYAAGLNPLFFRYYPTFDHACCWLALWPEILAEKPWSLVPHK